MNVDSPLDNGLDMEDFDLNIPDESQTESPHDPAPLETIHTRYASVIYLINSPPVHARLPYGIRNDFYQAAARAIQIQDEQIVLLHSIQHPHTDLEMSPVTPMIAQIVHEIAPGSGHRYILIDVEFHAARPLLQPDVSRAAKLLPSQLTRQQLLQINAVHQYCHRARAAQTGCLAWINHQLIPEQRLGIITLQHGDYVKIALPPDDRTCFEYTIREMAAICWTDSQLFADLGAAGRPLLPENLPDVPPDISTVYSMPDRIYETDDSAMLQMSSGSHPYEATDSVHHAAPLRDITNLVSTPDDQCASPSSTRQVDGDIPISGFRLPRDGQEAQPIYLFECCMFHPVSFK